MEVYSWENHRKTMGKWRFIAGKTIGKPWENGGLPSGYVNSLRTGKLPFTVDLPKLQNGESFRRYVTVYQRVCILNYDNYGKQLLVIIIGDNHGKQLQSYQLHIITMFSRENWNRKPWDFYHEDHGADSGFNSLKPIQWKNINDNYGTWL